MEPNINREEKEVLKELRKVNIMIILTAGKGVAKVVMDREEYRRKAGEWLNQQTCNTIPAFLTIKQKNKLMNLLKNIKAERCINETIYRRMYLTGAGPPKF